MIASNSGARRPAERAEAARKGADGADLIHLVDLDAAFGGGSNAERRAALIGELEVEVQLSGGIRDGVSLQRAVSTGCARVVIGTEAVQPRERISGNMLCIEHMFDNM